jgi:protoheme IX farnesyltransferase
VLVAFTLLPVATGFLGAAYAVAAAGLGVAFTALAVRLLRSPSRRAALRLYLSSLAYLALLFCAMAVDRVVGA